MLNMYVESNVTFNAPHVITPTLQGYPRSI